MSDKVNDLLDDFSVTIEMSVKEINVLLNCLNTPMQVPTTTAVHFITLIQDQARPQVEKAQKSLEAVVAANKEAKSEQ